ncbi:hypothetical protein BFP70_05260 [Thioclava sp. SK-1]|uniref:helix-turn-helix transcriptional regulator n=1 Tax=Thioclava sp. SK-1 TaxID=1889770 RepID=UPI000825173D|nr:hypothetical protein [Thioclava sp. SK-1]OCX66430.1 hypothetical protein BFP70_05260 [Thioclava sp. SK-1]
MTEQDVIAALFLASSGVVRGHDGAQHSVSSPNGGPEGAQGAEPWTDAEALDGAWSVFLTRLAQMTQAVGAGLWQLRHGDVVQAWQVGDVPLPRAQQVLERMRSQRVYSQLDLPSPHPWPDPVRALRWRIDGDSHAVLVLGRRGRDFRAADGAAMARLGPYLGPAIQGWQARWHAQQAAARDRRIGEALGGFWCRFSGSGRVIAQSKGLRDRLAGTQMTLNAAGWPEFTTPDIARAFRQIFAAAQTSDGGAQAIDLSGAAPMQMVLQPDPHMLRGVFGLIRCAPQLHDHMAGQVAHHFGLPLSEARLAMLICDGHSLQQASDILGWTIATTRSCSKQIYAALGVNGQLGVMYKLQTSAIWLSV